MEINTISGMALYTQVSSCDGVWMARMEKPSDADISDFRRWLQVQSLARSFVRMDEVLFHYVLPFNSMDHGMIICSEDITNELIDVKDTGVYWNIYPVIKAEEIPHTIIREEPKSDAVTNPSHYTEGRKYQPKDVIRDWELNFNLGNVVKYVSRVGRKIDALEDLKKARQYLDFEIEAMEGEDIQYLKNKIKDVEAEIRAKNLR